MAKVDFGTWEAAAEAPWVGEVRGPATLVPGGAMLDSSAFSVDENGVRHVQSGTVIGRTYAERDAGTGFGPVADDGAGSVTDEEVYILAYDVSDADHNAECVLYKPGSVIKENHLPEVLAGSLSAAALDVVRDRYVSVRGAE